METSTPHAGTIGRGTRQTSRRAAGDKPDDERRKVKEMKGRILKIKTGYNPNSSSIGVDMVAFLTAGAAVTVLFNTIAAILSAAKAQKHARPEEMEAPSAPGSREERR